MSLFNVPPKFWKNVKVSILVLLFVVFSYETYTETRSAISFFDKRIITEAEVVAVQQENRKLVHTDRYIHTVEFTDARGAARINIQDKLTEEFTIGDTIPIQYIRSSEHVIGYLYPSQFMPGFIYGPAGAALITLVLLLLSLGRQKKSD